MALSESAKLSMAFKKLIGVEHRYSSNQWYNECPDKTLTMHKNAVMVNSVPSVPPAATTATIKVYTDAGDGNITMCADNTIPGNRGWRANDAGALRNFVHPKFGSGYSVRIYNDDGAGGKGAEIFTTDAIEWFFDYENGYLALENTPTGKTLPLHIEAYRYIGKFLEEYVELTALTTDPATPPANTVRLYALDSAGTTKLLYIDSAGTKTQIGAGGGAGFGVYIEEGASAVTNNAASNMYLSFGSDQFDVTTASGTSVSITLEDPLRVGTLNVTAALSVQTTLHVSGAVTFGSTLNISAAVSMSSTLWVCGSSTLNGITNSGILTTGTLNVTANASVQGTFHVSGASTFGSTLNISGAVSLSSTLFVCGTTTLNGLTVSGSVSIQTLSITGNASVQGTLWVSGSSTFNGITNSGILTTTTLNVTANTSVQGTLWVSGSSTFNGITNSGVLTTQTLNVTANASVQGTLHVSGASTFGSTVVVSSTLSVNAATNISGTTTITGILNATTLNVTANASVGGTLYICGAVTFANNLLICGTSTNIKGAVSVGTTLWVCGTTTLNILNVSGNTTIENLSVTGNATVVGTLKACGIVTFSNNLIVSGTLTVDGATIVNDTFLVSGAATFSTVTTSGALTVGGNATLSGTLTVTGNTSVTGTLFVGGDVIFGKNLYVSGNITVSGDVTISGNLTTGGYHYLVGGFLGAGNWSCRKTLYVCGSTTLGAEASVSGNLTVNGTTKINSTLEVTSTITQDINYAKSYIEFTAAAGNPAAGVNCVRLYAKVTGTGTKLMLIDSAGTTSEIPGAGGGGADTQLSNLTNVALGISLWTGAGKTESVDLGGATCGFRTLYTKEIKTTTAGYTYCQSLAPTASGTYNLGGPAYRWWYEYTDRIVFSNSFSFAASSANTLGTSGVLRVDNNLQSKSVVAFGNTAALNGTVAVNVLHKFTTQEVQYGIFCAPQFEPAVTDTFPKAGLGGYALLKNNNFAGGTVYGLNFGPYVLFADGGHTAMTSYGARVAGVDGYGGTIRFDRAYGLYAQGADSDSLNTIQCGHSTYAIYAADNIGEAHYTAQYGIAADKPTKGAFNYQMFLSGEGTGSGIWFSTVANGPRIFASATNDLNISINNTSIMSITTSQVTIVSGQMTYQLVLGGVAVCAALTVGPGIYLNGTTGIRIGCQGGTGTASECMISNMTVYSAGNDYVMWDTADKTLHYQAVASARKYKTNIKDWNEDIKKILEVKPKTFNWINTGTPSIGYVAEDIEELGLEKLIIREQSGELKGLHYDKFIMYAIEVIKQQQNEIAELKDEVTKMATTINTLVETVDILVDKIMGGK